MNAPAPPTAEQQQAALAWLGQINQQPARAEGAAFKRWLLADPAHPQAWRCGSRPPRLQHAWPPKTPRHWTPTCARWTGLGAVGRPVWPGWHWLPA
jgi:ferric-dicitrate binding protein FerR (iron transport regulator)